MRDLRFFFVRSIVSAIFEEKINPASKELDRAMKGDKAKAIRYRLGVLINEVQACEKNLDNMVHDFDQAVKVREEHDKEKDVETSETCDDCELVEKCELVDDAEKVEKEIQESE